MKFSEFLSNYFIDDSSYIVGYNAEADVNIKIPILTLIGILSNITGTGTENMGTKWSGPQTLTDSSFFDNGNLVKTLHGTTTKGLYLDFANSTYKLGNGGNNGLVILPSNKATFSSSVTATEFIKLGGLSTEFLKADGTVDTNAYQKEITLTTIGSTGPATLIGDVLNIPDYASTSGTVLSVNDQLPDLAGNVSLTTGNVPEVGNLYYTDARARQSLSSTATGLTYTFESGVFSLTVGYAIPTTTEITTWNDMAAGGVTIATDQTITGLKTFGASGGSGYIYFPNTTSGYESRFETVFGSNAFNIYGAGNKIAFTQNDVQIGLTTYLNVNKGTHIASIGVNSTERLKIEGSGAINKSQFLNTVVLINSTTDDGSAVLQVTGNEKLKGNMIFDNQTRQIYWGDGGTAIAFVGDEMNFSNWYGYFRYKKSSTGETQMYLDLAGNMRTRGYFGPINTLSTTTVSGSNGEGGSAGTNLILQGGTSGVGPVYGGGNGGDVIIKSGLATDNSSGFGGIAGNIIFQYGNYNTDGWFEFGRINKSGRFLIGSTTDNTLAQVQLSGALYIGTIDNTTTDTNKYLVSDGGVVKYITGTQLLAFIGGGVGTVTSVDMSVPTGLSISGNPITTTGTLALTYTAGYSIPTNSSQTNWDTAYTNRITSLTTTGASGSATLISNTLNVPTYTLAGLGGVPSSSISGTSGYIAKFGASNTLGDSIISDNGSIVTVGGGITANGDITVNNLNDIVFYDTTLSAVKALINNNQLFIGTSSGTKDPGFTNFQLTNSAVSGLTDSSFAVSDQSMSMSTFVNSAASEPRMETEKARGTFLVPLPLSNGDDIGGMHFRGLGASGYKNSFMIRSTAVGAESSGVFPTETKFYNRKLGSTGGTIPEIALTIDKYNIIRSSSAFQPGRLTTTERNALTGLVGGEIIYNTTVSSLQEYSGGVWSNISSGGTVTSVDMSVPTGLSISGNPITSSGTLALTYTAGYAIPTTSSQTNWDTAYTNRITSLTTTGSSGSATLIANTLNIPTYTLAGLGGISLTSLSSTATGLTYSNTTGVFSLTSGYVIPTTTEETNWNTAYTNRITSLTTTGTSGAATLIGNTLNIPNYAITSGTVTSVDMTVPTGLSISGNPITSSGTFALTYTAGYSIPTNASQTNWDTAYTNRITSLTTTGASGSATLIGNVLNIPTYTLSGLGGITLSDLSSTATGLTYNNTTGVFSLTSGYVIPTTTEETNWDTAYTNRITSLTTTGSSGAATLISNVLNIPNYTLSSLGGVPYTGAVANVDLGEYQLKAGQLALDLTPTGTAGVGIMRWNDTDGTIDFQLKGGNVTLQVGQEIVARVVNKSGANLLEANYQVVKVSDAQGQRLAVDLAQADNDANSADTLGIVTETINNNQEGFITILGNVNEINTTGSLQGETWVDGDILYLSATTAGEITNVKPAAPQHLVVVGYVIYAHAIHGKIYTKIQNGYELNELHDVLITTPLNNQVLGYESSTSLWKNASIATWLGYTPYNAASISGTSGTIPLFGASNTLGNSLITQSGSNITTTGNSVITGNLTVDTNTLFVDSVNNRVGIGTISPLSGMMHYYGAAGASAVRWSEAATTVGFVGGAQGLVTGKNGSFMVRGESGLVLSGVGNGNNLFIDSTGDIQTASATDTGEHFIIGGSARINGTATITGAVTGSSTAQFTKLGLGNVPITGVMQRMSGSFNEAYSDLATYGILNDVFLSTAPTTYRGFTSSPSTNTGGTLAEVTHFRAAQGAFVGTPTLQVGYQVSSLMVGATTNYAFQGLLASATGRWNLYMSGTASNYLAGALGIGTNSLQGNSLTIGKAMTGGVTVFNVTNSSTIQSDVTSHAQMYRAEPSTNASAFTVATIINYQSGFGTKGVGSTITDFIGYNASDSSVATNTYGFKGNVASGTNKWNFYASGTAANYLAGNLLIGGNALSTNRKISIEGNITGSVTSYGIDQYVTISSDVTTSMFGYRSNPSTAAAVFTLPNLYHFYANDAGIGAGSTVTNQYGFYSSIASGTGKWGLYMGGTANNYLAGNTLIGSATAVTGAKLEVTGTASISSTLAVTGVTTTSANIIINGLATGTNTFLQLKNNSSSILLVGSDASISGGAAADIGFYTYGANNLDFWANSSRIVRFAGDGKVGIGTGTTAPATKVDVKNGTINSSATWGFALGVTAALPNGVGVWYHSDGATTGHTKFVSNLGGLRLGVEGNTNVLDFVKTTGAATFSSTLASGAITSTIATAGASNVIGYFNNTDYTAGNKSAIRVRQQTGVSTGYSAYLGMDGSTLFLSNDTMATKHLAITTAGAATFSSSVTATSFIKSGSSDSFFLLGGGGTVATSSYQGAITLTTTGTSGVATLIGNTLNIPNYASGGGSGTVTSVDMTVPTGLSISGNPITTTGTLALTYTAGYAIPTTAKQTQWDTAYTNRITSLTVTGSSGAATLVANVLNIPTYTLAGLGGQPLDATLTALAAFNTNGIMVQTAADTFTGRTITGTANQVTVTNGNGVSGNPVLALPQDIHTGASPTFVALNLTTGNLNLGTSSNAGVVNMYNATSVPSASITNGVILYAQDVDPGTGASSELKVRDEAGNITTLSPHNFSLIPNGPSEELAWSYYSEKKGKKINVDMLKLARLVESLTDEQLVFIQ